MNKSNPMRRPLDLIVWMGLLTVIAVLAGCTNRSSDTDDQGTQQPEVNTIENDNFEEVTSAHSVTPFLTFQGKKAQEAIDFYVGLIPNSHVEEIQHYGDSNPDFADWIMFATVTIGGQSVRFSDSPIEHAFDFTPSISFLVECESEEEITTLASALEVDGNVLMPMDSYGFSEKFTWVEDRFGVSWQLIYGATM